MSSLTTSDVKVKNKENLVKYIYNQKRTHQIQICEALNLSRPTVISMIRECEEQGVIEKKGFYESTGGRKANAIRFIADAKIAIGVELLQDSYEITALDLYGETLHWGRFHLPFQNSDHYFRPVCESVLEFIESNSIPPEKILGIGIVLQGLISSDGCHVTYGKILNCTGLGIDSFTKYIPYPCKFFHDAEAAAQDELWQSPNLRNAIYMNIRSHVSGAIIVNREFLKGTELKSGVFEHMTLIPDGRQCYCGHKGCVETYCSTQSLLENADSLDDFFKKMNRGDAACKKQWMDYLKYLASSINNLHMFIDYPVIIGGTLSPYLQGRDISTLHRLIYNITAFPTEKEFIRPSCCPNSPISRGAALPYVTKYLKTIVGRP